MKESDLYEPLKQFLLNQMRCQSIYAEVGLYDVVALKGNVTIVVEMKKHLNFKVLEQAYRARTASDYYFISVPEPKQYHGWFIRDILKKYGIGLIYVDVEKQQAHIEEWGVRSRAKNHSIRHLIREGYHDKLTGGLKSGEFRTEYGETIERVKTFLKWHRRDRWATVDEILEYVQTHYSSPKASLTATLKETWNAEWCEWKIEKRKTYFRYKEGEQA
ncbi:hypothetical protein FCT18_14660 [Lysinibacillus sphaericus]|uniref:Uncharacterized conserved protein n=1 Tax=Lysinibacillus sphaericus TaxID=1421 RepID=A0A2S0K668_LYSSH|nr:hypothetical protein [Lysinibacillus sphaericus]AVK98861.1 hypothetical protein LS41612_22505 [Lysinibacillus sphaericus]MED4545275.1 hypothetical protein [Lysinibacillus sphaericus]TKI18337.1 hypothetical protein FCT18_14660 [Lysinibacillus sphaericus]SUV15120.1 Uncharacterized conserved protein [Lysinibacillus sphaericus]GEC82219.1 hypothetical protein LSP03_19620 [Lysinibacillus sphaericus]